MYAAVVDIKVIESSKTWKTAFNVSANVLLVVAVVWCFCEGWRRGGLSGLLVLSALISSVLVHVLCSIGGVRGEYYLRAAYLAFVLGNLILFLNIMPTDSLVVAVGDLSGTVSLIEPIVVFVIFILSVSVQIFLLGNLGKQKEVLYVTYACIGVIALLLPRMIDSYSLLWGCVQNNCEGKGCEFAALVPIYNVSFAFVATLGVLALVIQFILPIVSKIPNFSRAK